LWFRFLSGGISAAAIVLYHGDKLTVGVGVVSAKMRNVALTAMRSPPSRGDFPVAWAASVTRYYAGACHLSRMRCD